MGMLKVKVRIYKVFLGERTLEREILTQIPYPAFQGENELTASLQRGYADILGIPVQSVEVELL